MVYISFNQKDLTGVLSVCNSVSQKRSEIDLFTMTKVDVSSSGSVKFMSINSTLFYIRELPSVKSEIKEDLTFLVNTDLLTAAVGLIRDDVVSFEVDLAKTSMSIVGAKSKHVIRINTANVDDFTFPENNEETQDALICVNGEAFLDSIKVSSTSVGNPRIVSQPEFLSICLQVNDPKEGLYVVSTDRFRMTQNLLTIIDSQINTEQGDDLLGDGGEGKKYLVDPKSVSLLNQVVFEGSKLNLSFQKNYLWVDFEGGKMAFRYREGKFPDWKKILPGSFSCNFNVNSDDLLDSLKQVYFSARSNAINKTINIEVDPGVGQIKFVARSDEDGSSSEASIEISNYEGVEDKWTQSFNADYLIDYISVVKTESILWEANPGKPSVLSPLGEKESQLCLISGLR